MIVLDASVMVAWLLGESSVARDTELDTGLRDEPALVPSHWPIEISNVLRTYLRAGRLSVSEFFTIMERMDLVSVQVEPSIELDEIGPLAQFSDTHDLTAYDAAYVQLALRNGASLATLDRALRAAAERLNIPLLPP